MAAAASNVMLAIDEKKASAADLYRPLRLYIASAYSERQAAEAEDNLRALRDLHAAALKQPSLLDPSSLQQRRNARRSRTALEQPSLPIPFSLEQRRDALLSYARALALVELLFPISADCGHVRSLPFTWHDAFKTNTKDSLPSIHLEKAAVLFDLGAVYSQIALAANRTTDVGIKTACRAFQSAAGVFEWLMKSGVAAKAVTAGATTIDVTPECARMLEKLMLAQAQECFLETLIATGRKHPAQCSMVAQQASIFYDDAYVALCKTSLSQHFNKSWVSHVQLKATQLYAAACYLFCMDLHEKGEIAQEIARLRIAISGLADAKKAAKGVAAPLLYYVNKLESNMKANLNRALKENDSVYRMRVLDACSLGALPAKLLAKCIAVVEDLDVSKERLFSSLVPNEIMKLHSEYKDMVDNIIRTKVEKLQQASEITRVRPKEMDLPVGAMKQY